MTTATPKPKHRTAVAPVLRAALLTTVSTGLVLMIVAALVSRRQGAIGALIGVVMVSAFFAGGALILGAVSALAPASSLMVALLTYTLKVVLIGAVFAVLSKSGALETSIDPRWLGGTVIVCTLVWLSTQIVTSMRTRIPVYDLALTDAEASGR